MPITVNPYGELISISTNVGGKLKTLQSISTNIGGQLKEIYTLVAKNIYGTWTKANGNSSENNLKYISDNLIAKNLRFPSNSFYRVNITIDITDGYISTGLDSIYTQFHQVKVMVGKYNSDGSFNSVISCGTTKETDTAYNYTSSLILTSDDLNGCNVYAGRYVYKSPRMSNMGEKTYYPNKDLSFDYKITFEKLN